MDIKRIAIHEAGHIIATLGTGCLLYSARIGPTKDRPQSGGHVYRGSQTDKQSAVIAISGIMSEYLYKSPIVNISKLIVELATCKPYATDLAHCHNYPLTPAAYEAQVCLEKRQGNLETLIGYLLLPKNQNRILSAAELFHMSRCRLLDSRKLPVPKRRIQTSQTRYTEAGYYRWLPPLKYAVVPRRIV